MITISMMDANSFIEGATLDKVAYKLRFNWSDVAGHWFLDVCDDKNKDIITGCQWCQISRYSISTSALADCRRVN